MSVSVDTKELKKLERHLVLFAEKAMPYAAKELLNKQAFTAQKDWRDNAATQMTLRSNWTKSSIRVDKATGTNLSTMKAVVGSVEPYMATQEGGAKQGKKGKHGVPIPAAAPGKRKNRKSRQARNHQLRNIKLLPRVKGHRSRQVGAAVAMAKKRGGEQFAYLELGRGRRGIYRIFSKKSGASALKKEWDLSKRGITIPKNEMMQPAAKSVMAQRDAFFRDALLVQLRRHKILGY